MQLCSFIEPPVLPSSPGVLDLVVFVMKTALLTTFSLVGTALGSGPAFSERDLGSLVSRQNTNPDSCKGYTAKNVKTNSNGLTADLTLAATCGIYGSDIQKLKLQVTYED
ncbi:hypothetical protein FRC07_009861, partial [Ceratobasidium sp. 392]